MNNNSSSSNANHQIVLAAFGTSTTSSAIYLRLQKQFEAHFSQKVPLGFTSRVGTPTLRTVLESIPPQEQLQVVIVPLFMVPGRVVLDEVMKVAEEYTHQFPLLKVAQPLLPDERVCQVVQEELVPDLRKSNYERVGILLVGHGTTDGDASLLYGEYAQRIAALFPPKVRVTLGNVEFSAPYCREVLGELIMSDINTLVVHPFMFVDGVHIHEDIKEALEGNHEESELYTHLLATYGNSLKERLKEIECIYKPGLGAYRGIFEIFADHTAHALSTGEVLSR